MSYEWFRLVVVAPALAGVVAAGIWLLAVRRRVGRPATLGGLALVGLAATEALLFSAFYAVPRRSHMEVAGVRVQYHVIMHTLDVLEGVNFSAGVLVLVACVAAGRGPAVDDAGPEE